MTLLLFGVLILTSSKSIAIGRCQYLFSDSSYFSDYSIEELSGPYKYFVHNTDKYTLGTLDPSMVKDQCRYGSCWAQATLSVWEHRAKKKGHPVELSTDFLIYSQLVEESWKALIHDPDKPHPIVQQGYYLPETADLFSAHGLIPKKDFVSRIDFKSSLAVSERMIFNLNALIGGLRLMIKSKKTEKTEKEVFSEVYKYLDSYFGRPPKDFEFEGQKFSPEEFAQASFFKAEHPEGFISIYEKENPKRLFQAIKNQLDQFHEPVRISLKWYKAFVDNTSGVVSIDAFNIFNFKQPYILDLAIKSDPYASNHAVDIVDYEVNKKGEPVKFLILNSWGSNTGDRGYYHLYWDYFVQFINEVRVYGVCDPSSK